MREESHLDEMRSAIRGDFERLAERRGEQELLRVADERDDEKSEEPARDVLAAPAALVEDEPEVEPDAPDLPRSWLARLFSPP